MKTADLILVQVMLSTTLYAKNEVTISGSAEYIHLLNAVLDLVNN